MLKRTNVVVDEELVERAKRVYGLRTTREVVDLALRQLVGSRKFEPRDILELRGMGWHGDLAEMRRDRFPDWQRRGREQDAAKRAKDKRR